MVSAAANREQARVGFDQAAKMVEASPALSAMAQVYRSEIVIPSTGSRYKVLSRDSRVQHGMDLHGAVIDELHAHPGRRALPRAHQLDGLPPAAGDVRHHDRLER